MAIDFPNSPTVGTTWPNPAVTGQPVYTWDGEKWTSGTGFGNIYISDSAPAAPVGSLWWQSSTGLLFVNYNDGTSTQWVAIGAGLYSGAVRFDSVQALTPAQQKQARANIAADSVVFEVDRNGVNQTVTANAYNKLQFTNKNKDANGWYDAVTNFRFQPTIVGSYLVQVSVNSSCSSTGQTPQSAIAKNGTVVFSGTYMGSSSLASAGFITAVSGIVVMNGTTDYVEAGVYAAPGVTTVSGNSINTFMHGFRVGD